MLCESDDDGLETADRSPCRLSGRPSVDGASEDLLAAAVPRAAVGVDGYAAVLELACELLLNDDGFPGVLGSGGSIDPEAALPGRRAAAEGVRVPMTEPAGDDSSEETVGERNVDGGFWRITSASALDDSASLEAPELVCVCRELPPRLRRGVGKADPREGVGRPVVGIPDMRGARGVECDMSERPSLWPEFCDVGQTYDLLSCLVEEVGRKSQPKDAPGPGTMPGRARRCSRAVDPAELACRLCDRRPGWRGLTFLRAFLLLTVCLWCLGCDNGGWACRTGVACVVVERFDRTRPARTHEGRENRERR